MHISIICAVRNGLICLARTRSRRRNCNYVVEERKIRLGGIFCCSSFLQFLPSNYLRSVLLCFFFFFFLFFCYLNLFPPICSSFFLTGVWELSLPFNPVMTSTIVFLLESRYYISAITELCNCNSMQS